MKLIKFQSTPPYGGRPHLGSIVEVAMQFQSTPPYGGRPTAARTKGDGTRVSIHAPVWGATDVWTASAEGA